MKKSMKELAAEAIAVQDACNLSGVVHGWDRAMTDLFNQRPADAGTDWLNRHPVNVLWASKVASLTGCESMDAFSHAYKACKDLAEVA